MKSSLKIRPINAADRATWAQLWTEYLEFYETSVEQQVYDSSFARLLDSDEHEFHGLIAESEGKPVGLVHYLFHRHMWKVENVCYLQDLYVSPETRGTGAGRALIEAVYERADIAGGAFGLLADTGFQPNRPPTLRPRRGTYPIHPVQSSVVSWRAAISGLMAFGTLAACTDPTVDAPARKAPQTEKTVSLMRFTPKSHSTGVARSNLDIAQDFLDLTFALETGKTLDQLLKFEGNIGVKLHGGLSGNFRPELRYLINRLRREARVPIDETASDDEANIHVHAVTKREIRRVFPGAACFIVPGVRNWAEFRGRSRSRGETRWSALERLDVISVFLPVDGAPQDTRDCLHEEIGQALGPANDLYRLADSIFNDDNFHSVLTSFDMLVLRTLYSPELRAGMTRNEVAAILPSLLDRLNPRGRGLEPKPRELEDAAWKATFERALTPRGTKTAQRAAAQRAVALSRNMQPADHRLGMSLLTLGRSKFKSDEKGAEEFREAYELHRQLFGNNDTRTAHSAVHLGVLALQSDDHARALELANTYIDVAREAENAVVLSALLAIRSEALAAQRQIALARTARLESLAWARYAYGDRDGKIADSEARIAALPTEFPSRLEILE